MTTADRLCLTRPLCVLWRPDGGLQVGLDTESALVVVDAPPGADAVVRALRTPRTPLEIARLVPLLPPDRLAALVGLLRHRGLVDGVPPTADAVTVLGEGPLSDAVIGLFTREGRAVRSGAHAVLAPTGFVVACSPTAEGDRVLTRDLTAAGLPHLVVRAEPERAVVGPFVDPGRTACVSCTDLVRHDLDPGWPHLLAQLCRSEHVPAPRQKSWAAATAVSQWVTWQAGGTPQASGATLELDAHTGTVGVRHWPRHPDCGCALAAA